jgi:hypothetical protein
MMRWTFGSRSLQGLDPLAHSGLLYKVVQEVQSSLCAQQQSLS